MMRKLIVMVALGGAILAMAPAAEAQWRNGHGGFRSHGPTVVVRPGPRVFLGFGGYPYYGGYYGGGYYGGYYGGYPYPYAYSPPVVYSAPPPVVYSAPPPAVYAAPPPAPDIQREVIYPHGKYVLEGDGVNYAYRWTWIASPTEPPPPPSVEPRQ